MCEYVKEAFQFTQGFRKGHGYNHERDIKSKIKNLLRRKQIMQAVNDKLSILAILSMTVCQKKNRQACNDSNNASGDFLRRKI